MTDSVASPEHNRRQRILREVLLVYVCVVVPVAILHPLRSVAFVNQYIWTAAMVLQVYLPAWILYQRGQPLAVCGLHLRRWPEGLGYTLLLSLLFLPPTVVGHHFWQQWNGFSTQHTASPYRQFSFSLRGEPPQADHGEIIQIFADMQRPELIIRWREPMQAVLRCHGSIQVVAGAQWVQGSTSGSLLRISGGTGSAQPLEVRIRVESTSVQYLFLRDQQPVSPAFLRVGPGQQAAQETSLSRDYWWILYIFLAQILMVALPEEFLYRGYILPRLDALFPPRYRWGLPFSWGNVYTSLLFALTHFVIGWSVHRLSVFFPSLLFGMLKQHTRSLLAPILFHAVANILIKLLEVWYY